MPRPSDVSDFGEAAYAQLAPVADLDEQNGWALLIFFGAIGAMFEPMDVLAHSTPPWSLLLDVDNIPAEGLPWLGQMIGTVVNINLPVEDQRQQIRDRLGWSRGTVQALADSIKPYLTGTQTVVIRERDTSAYHFAISTYGDETPPGVTYSNIYVGYATYAAFLAAFATYSAYWLTDVRNQINLLIKATKPAGLQFVYTVTPGHP